jgi:hypothetical protein
MKENLLQQQQTTTEPETFIVQNVTMGPHYVSDIKLNFAPLQAIDLTWEDSRIVKASKDLRTSLRLGFLKKISPEQFENIEQRAANREKKELLKQQKNTNMRKMDVDGRELEVEYIDAEKAYNPDKTVSTAGYANDSLSYAMALDVAQKQAELNGDDLSVEQFADMVSTDPNIVGRMLAAQKNLDANSSVSGQTRTGNAFYATPPSDSSQGSRVTSARMTNLNKDGYIAGGEFNYLDAPTAYDETEDIIAEAIDLENSSDDDKGSIKRV